MSDCVTLYLDHRGEKHPAYYGVVKAHGHKAALQNYLESMEGVLSSRFQKKSFNDLVDFSETIPRGKSKFGGASKSKVLVGKFDSREVAMGQTFYRMIKESIREDATLKAKFDAEDYKGQKAFEQKLMAQLREKFDADPEFATEVNDETDERMNEWILSETEKTALHEVLEDYVAYAADHVVEEDYNYEAMSKTYFSGDNVTLTDVEKKVITSMNVLLKKIYARDPNAKLKTEFRIQGPGWENTSAIDLIVYSPAQNHATIYDYKFYDTRAIEDYNIKSRGMLDGVADVMYNNRASLNDIQLSDYRRSIEAHDVNFTIEQVIVPFEVKKSKESTRTNVIYEDVRMLDPRPTTYVKGIIEEIMTERGIPIKRTVAERKVQGKVSGHDSFAEHVLDKSRTYQGHTSEVISSIDEVHVVKRDGKYYFENRILHVTQELTGETKAARDGILKEYVKMFNKYIPKLKQEVLAYVQSDRKGWNPSSEDEGSGAVNILEAILEEGKNKEGRDKTLERMKAEAKRPLANNANVEKQLRKLFQDMSTKEYIFEDLANDPRFKNTGEPIMIKATHRITGAIRIICVLSHSPRTLDFDHDNNKNYNTVLGNFMTKSKATSYGVDMNGDEMEMSKLLAGEVMKQMKYDDSNLQFIPPKVGVLRGNSSPSAGSLAQLDQAFKVLSNAIKDEDTTTEYKNIMNTSLVEGNDFVTMAHKELYDILHTSKVLQESMESDTMDFMTYMSSIHITDPRNYDAYVVQLQEFQVKMDKLKSQGIFDRDRHFFAEYNKIANLIVALRGLDPNVNAGDGTIHDRWLKDFTTADNIHNPYINYMAAEYSRAEINTFQSYVDRKGSFDKVLNAYLKSEGYSPAMAKISKKNGSTVFSKLFKEYDASKPTSILVNMNVLKDPDSSELSPQAKTLIKYMIKTKEDMIINYHGQEYLDKLKADPEYQPGQMVVQGQSHVSAQHEGTSKESVLQRGWNGIAGRSKTVYGIEGRKDRTGLHSNFLAQVSDDSTRLEAAGYSAVGSKKAGGKDVIIETNFDQLFDAMVLHTFQKKNFDRALQTKVAIMTVLQSKEFTNDIESKDVQKMLQQFTEIIIFGSIEDPYNDQASKGVGKATTVFSRSQLWGSAGYFMLELTTNSIGIGAETTSQFFSGLFGFDKDYSTASMGKAIAVMMNDQTLSHKLALKYNMLVRDSGKLSNARFHLSQSTGLTSQLFSQINGWPIEKAQTALLLAMMIHDGSFYAYSLSEDEELVYDEKKDKRFFKQKGEKISKKEEQKRTANLDFHKAELESEDGVNADGTLKRAYTAKRIKTIRTLTTERLSSMSSDQKVTFAAEGMGIAFMQFKMWMVAKKERWYRGYNPSSQLKYKQKWVADENRPNGGDWVWQGETSEGLLNSLAAMMRGDIFSDRAKANLPKELLITRRHNMVKLTNDMTWLFAMAMIGKVVFQGLFDDEEEVTDETAQAFIQDLEKRNGVYAAKTEEKGELFQLAEKTWSNAAGDIFILNPIYGVFMGRGATMVPFLSGFQRMASAMMGVAVLPFADDPGGAATTAVEDAVTSFGLGRTFYIAKDTFGGE